MDTLTPKENPMLCIQPPCKNIQLSCDNMRLNIGLMHTLFTLEDLYCLTVSESADGEICLKIDTSKGKDAHELQKMLYAWKEQADKLSSEEISKDKYDEWRYHYPEFDTTQTWAKVPSQALSDALVEMFQDKLKPDK